MSLNLNLNLSGVRSATMRRSSGRVALAASADRLHYAALAAVLLVGAYLRLTALARQSLWFDEIDVVVRAQRPFSQVLHTFVAAGENGPFYNVLLALWVRAFGISETAVRLPSALAGVLAIPLIYLLGRRLAGRAVGLLAAGLLAISPYHVWYSQEAKMYSIVVLLALASSYALVEALESNRRLWWALYVLATSLMFYNHVATVLVFVAQSLYAVATVRSWPGRRRSWLVAVALLTLPYLPIALWALKVISGGAPTWQPHARLWDALRIFATKFALNRYPDLAIEARAALLYALLAGLGVAVLAARERRRRWWLFLLLLSVVPVVGLWLVSLRQSVFADRYAMVALPAYLVLVAVAVVWLIRRRVLWPLSLVVIALLLIYAWGPLRDVNRTSSQQKEDWRDGFAWVAARAQPGDEILIDPGYMLNLYAYYAQRQPSLVEQRPLPVPGFRGALDQAAPARLLQQQAPGATRFWLVESPERAAGEDPQQLMRRWLSSHGTASSEFRANGVHITLYQLAAPPGR